MKRKRIFALVFALFLLIVFCACSASPSDTEKITVSEVTHSVFYAPQYAAIALGFFEEEGLEIELINGGGADKVMTAVLSNQVDIGFAGPEASIYVYNEGREDYAMVFAQLTKRDGSFIVSRKPEENFSFEQLKGTHILGGRAGGVPFMTLEYVLKRHGVSKENSILDTSIDFNNMGGAFSAGTGDYVTLFEPVASALEMEGKGYIVASVGEEAGEIPYTAYFAKKSYLSEHSDTIERFTRAIYKAQQWIESQDAKTIAKTIAEFFPDTDLALLTKVAERYKSIDAWNQTPLLTKESFARLQTVMEEAGELETLAPYEKLVSTEFAEKAVQP